MRIKKMNNTLNKLKILTLTVLTTAITNVNAYATDGEAQYNNILTWILGWIQRIGIVLTIWGAVQIGLSFSTEDAGQRRKGILELISGLMVMAIGFGAKSIIGY